MTFKKSEDPTCRADDTVTGHRLEEGWGVYRNDPEATEGIDELIAVVDTEHMADLMLAALNPSAEIQIVMSNDGAGETPTLLTYDKDKAQAKYLELARSFGRRLDANESSQVYDVKADADGIERGSCYADEVPCVRLDGEWYALQDQYGDLVVRWFVDRVE